MNLQESRAAPAPGSQEGLIAGGEFGWAARRFADRDTVLFEDRRLTYRELDRRANRLANLVRGLGLATGDRVAVLLNNSIESIETVVGLTKAGVAYVPLNARHTAEEHAGILNDSGAAALIAGPEFAAVVNEAVDLSPTVRATIGVGWQDARFRDYETLMAAASEDDPQVRVRPDDYIRIHYTSGTTGEPKGIAYSHGRWLERQRNFFMSVEYALGVEHSMIHVGPLTHAAGNYLYPYYLRGARNLVLRKFDPDALFAAIERERITHMLVVPTMLSRMLDHLDREGGKYDLSSLCIVNYGTAPTPVELLRRGIERFGPIFRQHYGMSEAPQPLTLLYPWEHDLSDPRTEGRLTSCGKPVCNVDITIRDQDGNEVAEGEIGEIALAARGVADVTFWRRPDLAAGTIRDGWFHSGDLGRFDADGYLHIVGRNKDMIISGGFNVYAREVEDALHRNRAILEAAVVGLPDPEWGEAVAAFVVPKSGASLDAETVRADCARHVAGYKKPRIVQFVDELPKNAAGKVVKGRLRDMYLERKEASDDQA